MRLSTKGRFAVTAMIDVLLIRIGVGNLPAGQRSLVTDSRWS